MRILLARHGQTDWNAAGRIQGQSDTPLNAAGQAQAAALARRLIAAGERPERLCASPKRRAFQTAQTAGALLGLVPEPVDALEEISFGHWEGTSWPDIRLRWPEEFARYQADRLGMAPEGGESFRAMLDRALPALEAIAAGPEGTVLVVSHSAVIKGVVCWLSGWDFAVMGRGLHLGNAQWAELDTDRLQSWGWGGAPDGSVKLPIAKADGI